MITRKHIHIVRWIAAVLLGCWGATVAAQSADDSEIPMTPEQIREANALGLAVDEYDKRKALVEARQQLDVGQPANAIRMLKDGVKRWPGERDFYRLLGLAYFEMEDFDNARTALGQAIALGHITPDVLGRLAQILQQTDEPAAATVLQLAQVVGKPNQSMVLLLAAHAEQREQYGLAESYYRYLIDQSPNNAELWLRLSKLATTRGEPNESIRCLETAYYLGAQPDIIVPVLAELLAQTTDLAAAAEWYERALLLNLDKNEHHRLRLAQLYLAMDDSRRATELATALTTASDAKTQQGAHLILGRIAAKSNDREAAVRHLEESGVAGPEHLQVFNFLGHFYYQSEQWPKAITYYQQSLALRETQQRVHERLCDAQLRVNDRAGAEHSIQGYLQQHGLDTQAEGFIQRLTAKAAEPTP